MLIPRVRPVRRQRRPGYPTRPEVKRDPELLRRHLPAAWKKSAQVAGALSILLAAGCRNDAGGRGRDVPKVAPVFVHGEGRGSAGCVMVNPAMFLSEEEALSVISDELGKAGLAMTQRNVKMDQIPIVQFRFHEGPQNAGVARLIGPTGPLTVDLMDPQKSVAVECVTTESYLRLGGEASMSSAQGYDCRAVAEELGKSIAQTKDAPGMFYGVFYDPIVDTKKRDSIRAGKITEKEYVPTLDVTLPEGERERDAEEKLRGEVKTWKKRYEQAWKDTQEESYALLRAQVKDFVEWLKGQGAI